MYFIYYFLIMGFIYVVNNWVNNKILVLILWKEMSNRVINNRIMIVIINNIKKKKNFV